MGEHYDDCFVVTATGRAYFFILRHANNDYGLVGFYNDGLVTTGLVRAISAASTRGAAKPYSTTSVL